MEQQFGSEMDITSIAQNVGVTPRHLRRLFLHETGETPSEFLQRIRLNEAAFRLKWADEATEALAHAVGFRSRPAFIRAFQRQFGMPPARYRRSLQARAPGAGCATSADVFTQELEPLRLLCRRYVGDIFQLRAYWTDFNARLPKELADSQSTLHIGQLHDDPRVTDPDKVRYDCGIVLTADYSCREGCLHHDDLHIVETMPGTYVGMHHRGHFAAIPETYDLLCINITHGRVPAAAPALEVHAVPRHMQDPESLSFTVLFPIE